MIGRQLKSKPAGFWIALGAPFVLLALVFSGCATSADSSQPYLILYAFEEEGELIRDNMSSITAEQLLGREVARGRLSGKDIVLAELGIGMNNAAMTAQKMLDVYRPKAVIVSGIAGSIDTSVHIGDIVVCDSWIVHDYGYVGRDGFIPYGIEVVLPGSDSLSTVEGFDVDSALIHVVEAIDVASLSLSGVADRAPQIRVRGVGVSGNAFIDSEEKRLWLSDRFAALITDMESAAVAQVCAVNDVPFIAFRAASDLAGGSGSETARAELNEFLRVAADNSSSVVMKYVEILSE
ncbi:MAG: 5'-methylthioadenosine/S-adenosylhomocysteine nucleosidase [Candidatus Zixiibacteriota bacterium]|nr:MAG: 5'-methylthioadenosine/S-adenosylhomocysteine nucleosidase [candidate division Zixibacteria bacterium]